MLCGDPKMPKARKELKIRALAKALRNEDSYIFAPDMGTDEECMAWVRDEIGRVVALPREIGGIPLDEIGATGFGLSQVAEVALEYCDFELRGARVVVQGFGAVGRHAARFLTARGALLVGAADSTGTIHNPRGLDVERLTEIKGLLLIAFPAPILILLSLAMALVGVVYIFAWSDASFDSSARIGLVLLFGIVVNNAILLVNQAGQLRAEKMPVMEALLEAGRRRLRPILMTTLTTILALMPLALGIGEGADAQAPLARAVVGGLAASTLITLVLIPVVYSLFHRDAVKT